MTFWEGAGAFLRWWACTLFLALAVWPITYQCLRRLPDRGFAFARMFGLLGVGYFFWLGCWLHLWPNVSGAVWLVAAALLAGGMLLAQRRDEKPWQWIREHGREVVFTEGVFLVLFAIWAWVRANNPQGDWAEKPMEIAFINSSMRSTYFPPNDPWLSGYAISYYHFGYIMTGMLAKISGLSGSVGFNLAVAASFAMAGCGAWGILRNLLLIRGRARLATEPELTTEEPAASWRKPPHASASRYLLISLLAPFCLLLLGNLEGFLDILYYHGVGWEDGKGLFWKWLDISERVDPPPVQTELVPTPYLWWWRASRVINDRTPAGEPGEVIDEFPAFTYVMGDLHPHVLAFPFLMAALAIVLEILLRGSEGWPEDGLERWLFIAFIAISIGSFLFLNTWDVLIFGMTAIAGWVGWQVSRKELSFATLLGWRAYAARWGVTGFLIIALYIPFLIGFSSQARGILPNVLFPTRGNQYFVMFGPLLVPMFFWILIELFENKAGLEWRRALRFVATGLVVLVVGSFILAFVVTMFQNVSSSLQGTLGGLTPTEAVSIAFVKRISDPLATLLPAFFAFAGLAITFGWIRKRSSASIKDSIPESPGDQIQLVDTYALILIFWGALLVVFPEYFYLQDVFGGRSNTVFKFYFQGWALWSLAAAYAVARMFQTLRDPSDRTGRRWPLAASGALLSVVFFALGAVFLPMMAWSKTEGFHPAGGPTLDAFAYQRLNYPEDAAAIDWINANIHDLGPIAEAVGKDFSDSGRVSTFTGLSAVFGWSFHEYQWRGSYREIDGRADDVAALFGTTDWIRAQEILDKYGVRYVYFGPLERHTYGARGLDKFRAHMKVIYQTDQVIIFERAVP